MKVPFLDLKAQYVSLKDEIDAAIQGVLDKTAFAGGPFVEQFEKEFAPYCQSRFACGVGSGTDALLFALIGLGVGGGDEVITVPNSFIATAEAISYCGASPVFVDVEQTTQTMDPARIEAAITPKTKAIIPVHLFGQMADMDPILEVARKHGLFVIEDACQAHGAEYKGHRAGSMGDAGCFSFYPGKNLGAYGEGGAVTTQNEKLAASIKMLRDHGQPKKYHHSVIGWNGRMDGIQGAILSVKLRRLDEANDSRRAHAAEYARLFSGAPGVSVPVESDSSRHVYHIYGVRVADRDRVMGELQGKDIGCGIHYPIPIHLQEAYAHLGLGAGSFPVAEQCAGELLSLPMYPELTSDQIGVVVDAVKDALAKAG